MGSNRIFSEKKRTNALKMRFDPITAEKKRTNALKMRFDPIIVFCGYTLRP